jgi:hypothetical protein
VARTTLAAVAAIIETDPDVVPDEAAMLPFILVANELVTECCTGTQGPATEYTAERLELIERWLAAHFYTNRDPRMSSESAGGVGGSYQSSVSLGFDTSHYGQTAMRLDTNGGLARLNQDTKKGGRPRVGVKWLGTPNSEIELTEGL